RMPRLKLFSEAFGSFGIETPNERITEEKYDRFVAVGAFWSAETITVMPSGDRSRSCYLNLAICAGKPAQLCVVTVTQMCPILQWRSGIENTQPNFKGDQRNENGTTQHCELQAPPPTRLAGFSQA